MSAMIHLDSALWPDKGSDVDDTVKVRFADSAANDLSSLAQTVAMMSGANAISTEIMVEMLHPDWTQRQIAEEVTRIKTAENEAAMRAMLLKQAASAKTTPQNEETPAEETGEGNGEETNTEENSRNGQYSAF